MPQCIKPVKLKDGLREWEVNKRIATSVLVNPSVSHNSKQIIQSKKSHNFLVISIKSRRRNPMLFLLHDLRVFVCIVGDLLKEL